MQGTFGEDLFNSYIPYFPLCQVIIWVFFGKLFFQASRLRSGSKLLLCKFRRNSLKCFSPLYYMIKIILSAVMTSNIPEIMALLTKREGDHGARVTQARGVFTVYDDNVFPFFSKFNVFSFMDF